MHIHDIFVDMSPRGHEGNADSLCVEGVVSIPKFTADEIQSSIGNLKKGKTDDAQGINAEELKECSKKKQKKLIRGTFNMILMQDYVTLRAW